jgi:mRNA interferase MazF
MPISEHPEIGTLLTCNFDAGFKEPEMIGRRLVVVVTPKIARRKGLCTVVPLSETAPHFPMPYHHKIIFDPPLPDSWGNHPRWLKGDMIVSVGFHRLDFVREGKDRYGQRIYRMNPVSDELLIQIRKCMLSSLGLGPLTKHL